MLTVSSMNIRLGSNEIIKDFSHRFEFTSAITGKNGVGKSTFLALLAGILQPDQGEVLFNNIPIRKKKAQYKFKMSYVPDHFSFYPFITGIELLNLILSLKRIEPDQTMFESLSTALKLENYLYQSFASMSLGTQKKCLLLAAFMSKPSVLLLDEPTNGLDKTTTQFLINYLSRIKDNTLLIFSSHDPDFIKSLQAREYHMAGNANIILENNNGLS